MSAISFNVSLLSGWFLASTDSDISYRAVVSSSLLWATLSIFIMSLRHIWTYLPNSCCNDRKTLIHLNCGSLGLNPQPTMLVCLSAMVVGSIVGRPIKVIAFLTPFLLSAIAHTISKWFEHFPDVAFGPLAAVGVPLGGAAGDLSLFVQCRDADSFACSSQGFQGHDDAILTLCFALAAWASCYEVIYGCKDAVHDYTAGVPMTAILVRDWISKPLLAALAILQTELLYQTGVLAGSGQVFFTVSVGVGSLLTAVVLWHVELKSPKSCLWWSSWGSFISGATILAGFIGDYATSEGIWHYGSDAQSKGVIRGLMAGVVNQVQGMSSGRGVSLHQ